MEELTKCRLCNYQSDKRLMLDVFDQGTDYSTKIESYLGFKISHATDTEQSICIHCSQALDNFHNFATKIKAIQKIIYPQQQQLPQRTEVQFEILQQPQQSLDEQIFEIQVINESQDSFEDLVKAPQKMFKVSTAETGDEVTLEEVTREAASGEDRPKEPNLFDFEERAEAPSEIDEEEFRLMRDADDEDFPSAAALGRIPAKLMENGGLIFKGQKLMRLMSIFYNTTCKLCVSARRFRSIRRLFEHMQTAHAGTEPYVTCCSMQLRKMPKIIWHFVKHIEPDAFKCQLCNYAVSRPKFLAIHQQTHLPDSQKPIECDLCGKRFIWKGALKNHLINHQSERRAFTCSTCGKNYQTAGSLATHRKSAHIDTSSRTRKLCEICSKSFSTLTSYKEHLTLHSDDRDKMQLKCPECGKWLKNRRCLKSHMLLHSSHEWRCELCEYVTKKEKLLRNHLVTKHSDERSHVCDAPGCRKSFKAKRLLTIHKAKDHGGKSVAKKCEFCGREFANSTNYYTHRKNLHARELEEVNERRREEEKLRRIKAGLGD